MISTQSAKAEFDEIVRDPATLPIEFQVGNPFLPTNRLILDTFDRPDSSHFRNERPSRRETRVAEPGPLKALFESQLRFSRVDASRMPNSPHFLDNLGLSEMNSGNIEAAEQHFREAVALDSEFFPAQAHLAKVCLLRRDYDAALGIYRRLHSQRPDDRQILINMANILLERRNLDEAGELLDQVLAAVPNDPHALSTLGIIHLIRGELRKAISSFRRSLVSNTRLIGSHNNLGVAYVISRNYRRAEREFQAMLALDGNNNRAVKNLAELYLITNRCDKAAGVLGAFLGRNDTDVEARTLLALCYLHLDQYKESLQHLRLALKYSTAFGLTAADRAKFSNNFGVVFHRLKETRTAEEYYKEAVEARPSKTTLCNLMQLYFEQKRLDDLRRTIERYSETYPDDGWGRMFLSRYYFEVRDYERAMSFAREAATQLPRATAPFALIGWIFTEIYGDYEAAKRTAREGLARDSQNRTMLNNLAYASLMAGDVSGARRILDQLDPAKDDVCLRATRGLLHIWEGDSKAGSQLYNEAKGMATTSELRALVEQKKHLELGKSLLRQNRVEEALSQFQRAMDQESDSPAHRNQARKLLVAATENR